MTRHEFLAALHEILRPATYLEVGVQYGTSLNLAIHSATAIGIDPEPLILPTGNQVLYTMTSDCFFDKIREGGTTRTLEADGKRWDHGVRRSIPPVDLAFIDGMHLFEYALRDFCNIERYCHPRSVVVFDDVLPRNQYEARRLAPGDPVLGDWTGDVWKVHSFLQLLRPNLAFRLVDTQPTGTMVVTRFPAEYVSWSPSGDLIEIAASTPDVPDDVLTRAYALEPAAALDTVKKEVLG